MDWKGAEGLRCFGAGRFVTKMVVNEVKTQRRGCRGAPSKRRNREKWIARTGGAAFAHRVGGPGVAPSEKSFGGGVGGNGAAAVVAAGDFESQGVAGATLVRPASVGGAAVAHREGAAVVASAEKTVCNGASGNGVVTWVITGARKVLSVAAAALDRLGSVGGVVASGGMVTPSGGVEQWDGADIAFYDSSSLQGGGLPPTAGASLQQGAEEEAFGGCCDNGVQGTSLSWWIRMEAVGLVVLHLCSYVCDDRRTGLALAIGVAVVVALGVWLRGDAQEVAMAAARRRWRAKPKEGCTRVSKKQRMALCWSRVFELMVAKGLAGEEARLRQELELLKDQLFKERERSKDEQGRLRRSRDEAEEKHGAMLTAWQEERERARQIMAEYVKLSDLDPKKSWSWVMEPGWNQGKAKSPATLE